MNHKINDYVWREYDVIPVEVGADAIEDLAAELVLLPLQRVELEHRLLGQVIALLNILFMSDESR